MDNLSFSRLQQKLSSEVLAHLPSLNIAILRNITIEPIEVYLRYLAYKIGLNAQVRFGAFDNIFQETVGGQGEIITDQVNYIFIFTQLETLSPSLFCNFPLLSKVDIESEKIHIKNYISSVLSSIRKRTNAVVLWHSFELPIYPSMGILDGQVTDGQIGVVIELNRLLRSILMENGNAYLVDMNQCVRRLGKNDFYDKRYWHIAKSPYTRLALSEIAKEDFKFVSALRGKNKKCIVLDCDNVLWGGIIGEDGLAGIKLGTTYPGSIYCELQKEILNLYNRGILIALCSKNNEEDVFDVFQNHPDMVIKDEHIVAYQINWEDKATNLRRLAQDLNIGLDSMVFIDDSDFEVSLIKQVLPEVEVIHLPKERTIDFKDILISRGLFDTLAVSAEDKDRGAMYKAEEFRKDLAAKAINLESYYKSLKMVVTIGFADYFNKPRIAQLTQKTNQFNLTTKRYSEIDINEFIENQYSDVIYIKLKDRFGDMGLVGVCILVYKEDTVIFDTFLLSCRVLGRKVEEVFFENCLKLSQDRGAKVVIGQYYATNKNMQVKDFFLQRGFKIMEKDEKKCIANLSLSNFTQKTPGIFQEIISGIDLVDVMEE